MSRNMEIRTYRIRTDKIKKGERPLRLVLLADLHDRLWGGGQEHLLSAIDGLRGDMILCAGDMLLGGEKACTEHVITLFEGLSRRNVPVIAANGNHESRMRQLKARYGKQYEEYAGRLRALGVHVLENETFSTRFGAARIRIHGYELPLKYYKKFQNLPYDTSDLRRKFGRIDAHDRDFHILLAHNPVYFKTCARWGADLTLSGHLHGGIIRIPGIGGVITPQAKLFPRYDRGLYEEQGKYLVVSAGLGEHTVPIRIFNPPQLIGIIVEGTG